MSLSIDFEISRSFGNAEFKTVDIDTLNADTVNVEELNAVNGGVNKPTFPVVALNAVPGSLDVNTIYHMEEPASPLGLDIPALIDEPANGDKVIFVFDDNGSNTWTIGTGNSWGHNLEYASDKSICIIEFIASPLGGGEWIPTMTREEYVAAPP